MSKKYLDYKKTIWNRAHFKDDTDMSKVIEVLNNGSLEDIFDEDLGFTENELLYNTSENITPNENYGQPTIEVYNQLEGTENWQECIWDNVNKFKQ